MSNLIGNGSIIYDQKQFRIIEFEAEKSLLLDWKQVDDLSLNVFKQGIIHFAQLCKEIKIKQAVIDATRLDQHGDPFLWVSGQKTHEGEETYNAWWLRDIVPVYHKAGTESLTVATGNPEAPGRLPDEVFPTVRFAIVYLTDLEAALQWRNQ